MKADRLPIHWDTCSGKREGGKEGGREGGREVGRGEESSKKEGKDKPYYHCKNRIVLLTKTFVSFLNH